MKSDLCESHQVFQRYHPNLSSSQRKTAVQPDPQITDKNVFCVACLLVAWVREKNAFWYYQRGIYVWFLLFA